MPYYNENDQTKTIFDLIKKYPYKEFRFFNIFNNKNNKIDNMNQAKNILNDFPNTKLIFQTSNLERIKKNFEFFKTL